jgi:hypothetical protein
MDSGVRRPSILRDEQFCRPSDLPFVKKLLADNLQQQKDKHSSASANDEKDENKRVRSLSNVQKATAKSIIPRANTPTLQPKQVKKGFDLQASLSKPLAYKPYRGNIRFRVPVRVRRGTHDIGPLKHNYLANPKSQPGSLDSRITHGVRKTERSATSAGKSKSLQSQVFDTIKRGLSLVHSPRSQRRANNTDA